MRSPEELTRSYALPEDPVLGAVADAVNQAGYWAWVVDAQWRVVYATDAVRFTYSGYQGLAAFAIGEHLFGPASLEIARTWRFGPNTPERMGVALAGLGGWMLTDTSGGLEELRRSLDASLRPMADRLKPADGEAQFVLFKGLGVGRDIDVPAVALRLRDAAGERMGTLLLFKPAASMAALSAMGSMGDLRHVDHMLRVGKPGRRPAAILFADVERSAALGRRLSTASYFALGRRLTTVADQVVIDAGGLVGRHVGDGIAAFFLAEICGSESAAAHACITAARSLRTALSELAARSQLAPDDIVLRFGLHWGSTLYVGSITTAGRFEVTALGDEVNEAARIEACATGGRALASKSLLERLDAGDAAALGLDPDRATYTALSELTNATEKARRDAAAIAVCEV
jgi:class 3 adenylate cyclase